MVALGMLAALLLLMTGLFLTILRGGQKSSDTTSGVIVAEQITLDRLHKVFHDEDEALTKHEFFESDATPLEGTVQLNQTTFTYRITHTTVNEPGGAPLGGAEAASNRVKKVDTVVWWWSEDAAPTARVGYGNLSVNTTRLVNEKAKFTP